MSPTDPDCNCDSGEGCVLHNDTAASLWGGGKLPTIKLRPGFWRTRCGATIELMKWNGKHWIGKLNCGQHWHDRWERDGVYAATSERFRAFDIVAAEVL